ncbi:unnamed protein product [Musa hybrid cultivar]
MPVAIPLTILPPPTVPPSFHTVKSREELKEWLKQFDIDKDGRISRQELRQAIHAASIYKHNKWLRNYLAGRRGVRNADINRNGFVDEDEMDNLVDFVAEIAGLRFIPGK